MRKGMRVGRVVLVLVDIQSVIAVKSVFGGNPDITPTVLIQSIHITAAEPVPHGQHQAALRPEKRRAQQKQKHEELFRHGQNVSGQS